MRRFSFYQDPSVWSGDIVENPDGEWVHWNDIRDYVTKAEHKTGEGTVISECENPLDSEVAHTQSPFPEDPLYTEEEYQQMMDDLLGNDIDTYEYMKRQHYGSRHETDES